MLTQLTPVLKNVQVFFMELASLIRVNKKKTTNAFSSLLQFTYN